MRKNKIKQPIYLMFFTLVLAIALSFLPEHLKIFGIELKHVDVLADLKEPKPIESETPADSNYNEDDEYYYDGEMDVIYEDENDSSMKLNKSNINRASIADGLMYLISETGEFILAELDNTKTSRSLNTKDQKITGYVGQLKNFFNALDKSKTKQVRIAHFGDSMIEGDLITSEIRNILQSKYGGKGVGWLSITSQDTKFRQTTKHTFSDGWDMASVYTRNPKKLPLGISGEIFIPEREAWMQYETNRRYRTMRSFEQVRLFYSDANASSIKYSLNGEREETGRLKKGRGIQELEITGKGDLTSVRFEVPKDAGYFYGVSLESKTGVYVDNFPLRGNSGVDLNDIDDGDLKDFAKYMDYDLVILEFGLNAVGSIKGNYSWYEKEMIKVVDKFKKAFPKASILMISVHDKAKKEGNRFVTDPEILRLLKTQQNVAKESKVAFWNLFEAMGGNNSMDEWVSANPPMAFKDYVHFNDQGARKVADMLTDALLDAYNKEK